jgi:predicted transcriptional regulator
MPKHTRPAMGVIKIPLDLRDRIAALAEERGCFQHRVLSEALSEYFAKHEVRKINR